MKIKIKDARELLGACRVLTSGTHTVLTRLGNGEQTATQIPYELDDKARWNLVKNLGLAEDLTKAADKVREGIVKELESRNGGKTVTKADAPDLFAEWLVRSEAVEEEQHSAPMLRVKRTGLKESNSNPVPGTIISALASIGVLQDDLPAPAQEDVIPD